MKIILEQSDTLHENYPDQPQRLEFDADNSEGAEWVQFTYNSLCDQTGLSILTWDPAHGDWVGEDGTHWSDVIVTP